MAENNQDMESLASKISPIESLLCLSHSQTVQFCCITCEKPLCKLCRKDHIQFHLVQQTQYEFISIDKLSEHFQTKVNELSTSMNRVKEVVETQQQACIDAVRTFFQDLSNNIETQYNGRYQADHSPLDWLKLYRDGHQFKERQDCLKRIQALLVELATHKKVENMCNYWQNTIKTRIAKAVKDPSTEVSPTEQASKPNATIQAASRAQSTTQDHYQRYPLYRRQNFYPPRHTFLRNQHYAPRSFNDGFRNNFQRPLNFQVNRSGPSTLGQSQFQQGGSYNRSFLQDRPPIRTSQQEHRPSELSSRSNNHNDSAHSIHNYQNNNHRNQPTYPNRTNYNRNYRDDRQGQRTFENPRFNNNRQVRYPERTTIIRKPAYPPRFVRQPYQQPNYQPRRS